MDRRKATLGGNTVTVLGKKIAVGERAPDFQLLDNNLNPKTLQDFKGAVKLISVVPSLDTGVCDHQTRHFNQEISNLDEALVITVSVDLPFAQKRWCGNAGFEGAITLSDHRDVSFGQAYGVLIEEVRLLARAVFVLDEHNTFQYVEYLEEMTNHPNYDAALEAVKSLFKA